MASDNFSAMPATIVDCRMLTKPCAVLSRFRVACHNALSYHPLMKQRLKILYFGCFVILDASCSAAWATSLLQCRAGLSKHEYVNVR